MHAIIFDIDGTLLQSAAVDEHLYEEAVRCELGDVKVRPSLDDYDFVTDSGILAQILADNSCDDDVAVVNAIKRRFVRLLQDHIDRNGAFPEVPGAMECLQQLDRSDGHLVAMATGGWQASATLKLETSGFAGLGIPLATSDDAVDRKDIMRIALSHLRQPVDAVTYIGDGSWDQRASAELGWDFIAVGPTLGGIDSFGELARLL